MPEEGDSSASPVAGFPPSAATNKSTNSLENVFTCPDGRARLTDFMPIHRPEQGHGSHAVRRHGGILRCAKGLSGAVDLRLTFKPTPNYAAAQAEILVPDSSNCDAASRQTVAISLSSFGRCSTYLDERDVGVLFLAVLQIPLRQEQEHYPVLSIHALEDATAG